MRRALWLAVAALAVAAPAAQAHARLEGTSPQRGATLHTQPRQVVFTFGEPVEGSFGAVRVFDAHARRVDDGRVVHPNGVGSKVAVALRPRLPDGTYTATYRVISADGHPVSGGLVFNVGHAGAAGGSTVADLLGHQTSGPATGVAFSAVRALGYLAMALAIGGLLFLVVVWRPALDSVDDLEDASRRAARGFAGRLRRVLAAGVIVGAVSSAAGIVLEGATAGGTSFWSALNPTVVGEVLGTRFGTMWAIRAVAWLVLGAGLVLAARARPGKAVGAGSAELPATDAALVGAGRNGHRSGAPTALATRPLAAARAPAGAALAGGGTGRSAAFPARSGSGAGGSVLSALRPGSGAGGSAGSGALAVGLAAVALLIALTPALAGHASTQSPTWLLIPADVVHVAAMCAWLGGLVLVAAALPAATRGLDPVQRTRLLAAVLARFSPLALAAVAALALTGVVQAVVEVRHLGALTSTAFGRAVLIKVALLGVLIGLGAVNRQRVVPALRRLAATGATPGGAGRLLRRTIRTEVALVLTILGVTGALTGYAPPVSLAGGPVSLNHRLGPLDLEMTVDPAQVGANEMHVYLFRARDGAPFTGTKQLTVQASLPDKAIGPLDITMHRAGPGHFVADAVALSPGGDWRVAVADRVSDFDEYTTSVKVPVH